MNFDLIWHQAQAIVREEELMAAAKKRVLTLPSDVALLPLNIALSQLNKQIDIDAYNYERPDYIAGSFDVWCINEACRLLNLNNPIVKTKVVVDWRFDPIPKGETPQPGDLFWLNIQGRRSHSGFIEHTDENRIYTVEDNTDEDRGSEGYKVYRKPEGRLISSIGSFMRVGFFAKCD